MFLTLGYQADLVGWSGWITKYRLDVKGFTFKQILCEYEANQLKDKGIIFF